MEPRGKHSSSWREVVRTEQEPCDTCEYLGSIRTRMTERTPSSSKITSSSSSSSASKSLPNLQQTSNKSSGESSPQEKVVLKSGKTVQYELPMNGIELGNCTWALLHTMAATYPDRPSPQAQQHMKSFLEAFSFVYPCTYCAEDFRFILDQYPPRLGSQKDFSLWMCEAHNHVNEQLGKPQFDCSRVEERWHPKLRSKVISKNSDL